VVRGRERTLVSRQWQEQRLDPRRREFVHQHAHDAGLGRLPRIERTKLRDPQDQLAQQRTHRDDAAGLDVEGRCRRAHREVQRPHRHVAPHADGVRAARGDRTARPGGIIQDVRSPVTVIAPLDANSS
jgi:hypothetical protein